MGGRVVVVPLVKLAPNGSHSLSLGQRAETPESRTRDLQHEVTESRERGGCWVAGLRTSASGVRPYTSLVRLEARCSMLEALTLSHILRAIPSYDPSISPIRGSATTPRRCGRDVKEIIWPTMKRQASPPPAHAANQESCPSSLHARRDETRANVLRSAGG